MISLIQLEYIIALDTHRHFAKAADACHVTQPTLSMQIKKLEEALGVLIFDRSKQPVVPTEIGHQIVEQAKRVLQEAARIPLLAEEDKGEIQGALRIGIIPTISPYLLPRFSVPFRQTYPKVQLKIQDMVSEDIISALHQDQLDVGILSTPIHEDGIFETPLYYEEMLLYTHREHPLMRNTHLVLNDISNDDIWLLNDGHCFKHQIINLCHLEHQTSSKLPFEFVGGNIETLIKIINQNGGYTLIPELASLDMPAEQQQQVKSFSKTHPLREISLIYTRKYEKARLIKALAGNIRQHIPAHMLQANGRQIVEWR